MLKVLVVDDDEIVLLVQRKILQRCGITNKPFTFKSGFDALDFLKAEENGAFLILLDINMPGMNGWQFLSRIKNLNPSVKIYVIMVTSSIDGYDKEVAAKYSEVIGFIEKPITSKNCEKIKSLPSIVKYFN